MNTRGRRLNWIALVVLTLAAGVVVAGNVTRIYDDGDGTVTVVRAKSLNSAAPMAPGELGRKPFDYALPGCAAKYYAWNGTEVVEASQAVKDAVDAAEAAAFKALCKAIGERATNNMDLVALVKCINKRIPGNTIKFDEWFNARTNLAAKTGQ